MFVAGAFFLWYGMIIHAFISLEFDTYPLYF